MNRFYRKRPEVIQAIEFDGTNSKEVEEFCNGKAKSTPSEKIVNILLDEGVLQATVGSWIVKEISGHLSLMSDEVFNRKYEKV